MPSSLGIVASGVQGFSPLDLSPALWLDASDTSTITASGGLVSQWNDKSGNARSVTQPTSADQPTTGSAAQNGRNVIVFNGTTNNMTGASSALSRNVAAMTIYLVYKWNAQPTSTNTVLAIQQGGAAPLVRLIMDGGTTSQRYRVGGRASDADATFIAAVSNTVTSTTAYRIQTAVADYSASVLRLFIGLTLDSTTTPFFGINTSDTDSARFRVGAGSAATAVGFANANIAEILVYHASHNASQRTTVWSYLTTKWGL